MKLIANWKAALSSYSAIALAVSSGLATVAALWDQMPVELKALIPQKELAVITVGVAAAGYVGRLIEQPHITAAAASPAAAAAVAEVVGDKVVDQVKSAIDDQADAIVADAKAAIVKAATK